MGLSLVLLGLLRPNPVSGGGGTTQSDLLEACDCMRAGQQAKFELQLKEDTEDPDKNLSKKGSFSPPAPTHCIVCTLLSLT